MNEDQFRTVLAQASEMLNNRPLTSVRQNKTQILTPNHFLIGRLNPELITESHKHTKKGAKLGAQWLAVEKLASEMWKSFMANILPELGPRSKWQTKFKPLKVGDLVLEMDENTPRNKWKLSLVEELIKSKDGLVRSVIIKQIQNDKDFYYERPVIRLIPISPELD